MKRIISLLSIFAIILGTMSGCSAKATENKADAADMLITNGIVYTADTAGTKAEAVAVKDGKIIFVGSSADAEKYSGDATEVIDADGSMILPGMFDSHLHSPGTMLTKLYNIDLNGVQTEADTMQIITDYIKAHPDLNEYYGSGYNLGVFKGVEAAQGPRKERLDAICSDKPIILRSLDGHSMWVNSKALEAAGITKDTPNPVGGIIEKDTNGELWGTLKESAEDLMPVQDFTDEQLLSAVRQFQSYLHSLGYVGINSMSGSRDQYVELDKNGELNLYINNAITMDPQGDVTAQVKAAAAERDSYSSENYRVGTLKFFADGVIEGATACLLEPYEKAAGKENGLFLWDTDKLNEAFRQANESGFQIHVHSVGDAATMKTLDALEFAKANAPEGDYRNCLTHLQLVRPEDFKRMADLKVIAATQPYWAFHEPNWWETVDSPFLGERAEKEYPMKSFLDAGVTLTSSSDHPVTSNNNPFWAIEVGVTRNLNAPEDYEVEPITDINDPKWLSWPEERVSVEDMIKSFTINGAYQAFDDKVTGSVEVGKNADLIIVDQNILDVDPLKIDSTKVLKTIFKGEVVYNAEDAQ